MKNTKNAVLVLFLLVGASTAWAASYVLPGGASVIKGTVTDVNGKRITILGSVTVDVGNAAIQKKKNSVALESIGPGSRIKVSLRGTSKGSSGVLFADIVEVEAADGQLIGTLEGRGTDTITVNGVQIGVDAETYVGGFQDAKPLTTLADLKQDYPVSVDVVASGKGLVAVAIMALGPTPAPPPVVPSTYATVTGTIQSITAARWVVGTTDVAITPKTVIPVPLAVGETAIVAGIKQPDGSIVADTIRRK